MSASPLNIRDVEQSDADEIAEIFNHYILNTTITFEENVIDGTEISARISEAIEQNMPWFVAEDDSHNFIGYAYASKWKGRCAYRRSVEVTIYLSPTQTGKGAGSQLYSVLIERLKSLGYHVVLGGISLPNPASTKLHENFGMTKSAHFKEVGFKFDQWVDVGYWHGYLDEKSR